jgi:hypothetical protein
MGLHSTRLAKNDRVLDFPSYSRVGVDFMRRNADRVYIVSFVRIYADEYAEAVEDKTEDFGR